MALLDNGPDVVYLYPYTRQRTPSGAFKETWNMDRPVTFTGGAMYPLSSTETGDLLDERVINAYQYYHRGPWPGTSKSRVQWNGKMFDQLGDAMVYHRSPRVAHVVVTLVLRDVDINDGLSYY